MRLLRYYQEADEVREMDEYLRGVEPVGLTAAQRGELIRCMTERDLNDKALSWVRRFGTSGVDERSLVRMCSRLLETEEHVEDPDLCAIIHTAYRGGKYNQNLLWYLGRYFEGTTEEMEEVRRSIVNFDLDDYEITRRMTDRILFTGSVPDNMETLLERCMAGGADPALACAVLAQSMHYYLIEDRLPDEKMFRRIEDYGREGVPLLDVCRIGWLRRLSEASGEITDGQQEVIRLFLSDLLGRGIVFPFYRQFIGFVPQLQTYADQTLVQYRAPSREARRIVYHYAMDEDERNVVFSEREMREMYEGIYVTGFLLFFGEQMHYFITDDPEGKHIVESGTVGQDARIADQGTKRFSMINDICLRTAMGRREEAFRLLKEYDRLAWSVRALLDWDTQQKH